MHGLTMPSAKWWRDFPADCGKRGIATDETARYTPHPLTMNAVPEENFQPTRWSLIRRVQSGDRTALNELCGAYRGPLLRYLLRSTLARKLQDAEDIVQGFLLRLATSDMLASADPGKGSLRSFFICVIHDLSVDALRRAGAAKRGGGSPHVSLDEDEYMAAILGAADPALTPVQALERDCDRVTLQRAISRFEAEFAGESKRADVARFCLVKWGLSESGALPREELLSRHGLTENALSISESRLKMRFRNVLRHAVLEIVADNEDIDAEIRRILGSRVV